MIKSPKKEKAFNLDTRAIPPLPDVRNIRITKRLNKRTVKLAEKSIPSSSSAREKNLAFSGNLYQ